MRIIIDTIRIRWHVGPQTTLCQERLPMLIIQLQRIKSVLTVYQQRVLSLSLLVFLLCAASTFKVTAAEVNLYSYRQPFLIQPLLAAFTEATGIAVNVTFAKSGIVDKIRAAGINNPADAVLTVDVSRLNALRQAGLLQSVNSSVINAAVPSQWRDPQGLWFGLSTRARVVVAHRERVAPGAIRRLEDLIANRFRGRICSRSGKHVYNLGLVALLLAEQGEDAAKRWLRGLKANLARKPQGNDRAQAKAIYQGVCDVALINHYYIGKMATNNEKPEQQAWANSLRVIFVDQQDRGQTVNVSGIGVLQHAKNKDHAVALIEFLVSEVAQNIYAKQNFEYPVRATVALHPLIASWGKFKPNTMSMDTIANYLPTASRLVDIIGFDN